MAIQLCAVRVYGRFFTPIHDISPRIANYLGSQLRLPPTLRVQVPEREATYLEHRQHILSHLGFHKFDEGIQGDLATWLTQQAQLGVLPEALFQQAEHYLLERRILLPGPSVLERLIIHSCAAVHSQLFEAMVQRLAPELRQAIDQVLTVPEGGQRSAFSTLKDYPPAATISSIQAYLKRYHTIAKTGIDAFEAPGVTATFLDYLFTLAKRYSAPDLKRFADPKRYALMIAFLLETRKHLLDHLVTMHDQYIMEMCRHAKHSHEQQHRELRKRQKRAIDVVLEATTLLLDWPAESAFSKEELWQQVDESKLRGSLVDLRTFQRLEERGYGELLLARYPSLRKYFVAFVHLPFAAKQGNESLLRALEIIRQLDAGTLKKLPTNAPTAFVPKELRRALYDQAAQINRNAWETGLALAIKDALRSGDLYLPQSKQHISFWDLTFNELHWQEVRTTACATLHQPPPREAKAVLTQQFHDATALAQQRFAGDTFAEIQEGKLTLKRDDTVAPPATVPALQKVIEARLPIIRIEQLLMDVDHLTHFSRHFTPVQGKPRQRFRYICGELTGSCLAYKPRQRFRYICGELTGSCLAYGCSTSDQAT